MKKLIMCLLVILLVSATGCKEQKKEQIVFPPDAQTAQNVGGYKNSIIIKQKETKDSDNQQVYCYNKSTKKFHLQNCRYAESCKDTTTAGKQELLNSGYEPCKICNP